MRRRAPAAELGAAEQGRLVQALARTQAREISCSEAWERLSQASLRTNGPVGAHLAFCATCAEECAAWVRAL